MKIESTGYKITGIIEGDSSCIIIPRQGDVITLALADGHGGRTEHVFGPDEFDVLRQAMNIAVSKAAKLRGEHPAPRPASPFDLMREMLDGGQGTACCGDLTPGDVRALIDDAEREYATRNATLPPYDASAATA